jgi:hypothetical protein
MTAKKFSSILVCSVINLSGRIYLGADDIADNA